MVEVNGIEPLTSCVQGRRSPSWAIPPYRKENRRTPNKEFPMSKVNTSAFEIPCSLFDILFLNWLVGLGGLEPPASRLSGVRSKPAELQALL